MPDEFNKALNKSFSENILKVERELKAMGFLRNHDPPCFFCEGYAPACIRFGPRELKEELALAKEYFRKEAAERHNEIDCIAHKCLGAEQAY